MPDSNTKYPTALAVAEPVLALWTALNLLYGAGVLAVLVASVVVPELTAEALLRKRGAGAGVVSSMRFLMVLGLAAVPVMHLILSRLRAIVFTVRQGDPFIAENAKRLDAIALGFLGLELLRLGVGALVTNSALAGLHMRINTGFSVTPWGAVLLLFVLARVFEHGTRMRADLEGTV